MAANPTDQFEMIDDLLTSLGGISPKRVRLKPTPGTATVADVIRLYQNHKRLFELVDGTLVEKGMGVQESSVAADLIQLLKNYSDAHGRIGMVLGEAGTLKLLKKLVRIPDVSYTRWERLPGRKVPVEPVPELAPELCVEVLSRANTTAEMERKLKEYFLAGVLLVWFIDPRERTIRVYTSPDNMTELGEGDTLDGGEVLPGFAVPVARLFADLVSPPKPATKPKPKKKR